MGMARLIALLGILALCASPLHAEAQATSGRQAGGRERFWKLVNESRAGGARDSVFMNRLGSSLGKLAPAQIAEFDRHFFELHRGSYRWDLWGACYLIMGGCSDDGFEYFRAWLVSQGQSVFEKALRDPDSLAALPGGGELEEFMQLPRRLYREKTGKELPYPPVGASSVPKDPVGAEWDFENRGENKKHLPRLWGKYGR